MTKRVKFFILRCKILFKTRQHTIQPQNSPNKSQKLFFQNRTKEQEEKRDEIDFRHREMNYDVQEVRRKVIKLKNHITIKSG